LLNNLWVTTYPALVQGLIACGVEMDRRALRINVADLHWQFVSNTLLVLEFTLPAGCYATALLREIIVFK
jgi:tRNA pseudouridine13 synthase